MLTMDFFDHFETVRRRDIDKLTAHPFDTLTGDELTSLADRMGLDLATLQAQKHEKSTLLTCPLCGQPSTHLVLCHGCGELTWGFEFEEAFGLEARALLKEKLFNVTKDVAGPEAAKTASKYTYNFNGCTVCPTCFHHTLPSKSYSICPLFLLCEFIIAGCCASLIIATVDEQTDEGIRQAALKWAAQVHRHWCSAWNTAIDPDEVLAIAEWRGAIIQGAIDAAND